MAHVHAERGTWSRLSASPSLSSSSLSPEVSDEEQVQAASSDECHNRGGKVKTHRSEGEKKGLTHVEARLFLRQCNYFVVCHLCSPPPTSPDSSRSPSSQSAACTLSVSVRNDSLQAQGPGGLERAPVYSGRFPRAFIEEMTRRTGRFASIETFWRLLVRAVHSRANGKCSTSGRSGTEETTKSNDDVNDDLESVSLNLWDVSDLEALRRSAGAAQRGNKERPSPSTSSSSSPSDEKHFLIITHRLGGRRIHYPLALQRQRDTRASEATEVVEGSKGGELDGSPTTEARDGGGRRGADDSSTPPDKGQSEGFHADAEKTRTRKNQEARRALNYAEQSHDTFRSPTSSTDRQGRPLPAVDVSSARSTASGSVPAAAPWSPTRTRTETYMTSRGSGVGMERTSGRNNMPCTKSSTRRFYSASSFGGMSVKENRLPLELHGDSVGSDDPKRLTARLQQVETELLVTTRQLESERHLRAQEALRLKQELDRALRTQASLRNRVRELETTLRLTSTTRSSRCPSVSSLGRPPSRAAGSSRSSSASSSRRGSASSLHYPTRTGSPSPYRRSIAPTGSCSQSRSRSSVRTSSPSYRLPLPFLPGPSADGAAVRYVRRGGGALVPVPLDPADSWNSHRRPTSSASNRTSRDGRTRSRSLSLEGGGAASRRTSPAMSRCSSSSHLSPYRAPPLLSSSPAVSSPLHSFSSPRYPHFPPPSNSHICGSLPSTAPGRLLGLPGHPLSTSRSSSRSSCFISSSIERDFSSSTRNRNPRYAAPGASSRALGRIGSRSPYRSGVGISSGPAYSMPARAPVFSRHPPPSGRPSASPGVAFGRTLPRCEKAETGPGLHVRTGSLLSSRDQFLSENKDPTGRERLAERAVWSEAEEKFVPSTGAMDGARRGPREQLLRGITRGSDGISSSSDRGVRRYGSPFPHANMGPTAGQLPHAGYPAFPSSQSPRAHPSDAHEFDGAAPYERESFLYSGPHDTPVTEKTLEDTADKTEPIVHHTATGNGHEESPYITIPVAEYRRLLRDSPAPGGVCEPEEMPFDDSGDCGGKRLDTRIRSDAANALPNPAQINEEPVGRTASPRGSASPRDITHDAGLDANQLYPDNHGLQRHRPSDTCRRSYGEMDSGEPRAKTAASNRPGSDAATQGKREPAAYTDASTEVEVDRQLPRSLRGETADCGKTARDSRLNVESNAKAGPPILAQVSDPRTKATVLGKNCESVGATGTGACGSRDGHVGPEACEADSAKNTYSEIDRRLTALQDFLKSTRQTFRMLERADAVQAD
ncbi:coiled-coil domain-containing protein 61 [Cystoisospora suis]|uniref:Coiled-coil domain-containing protein 61 n=1 Tax=Cystoisospora suis TaxID=483139 RepID=A0A2C6L8Z2_9APIC|nr:coiled-coil domain-containing protein 61 [Cystoisospora suis]